LRDLADHAQDFENHQTGKLLLLALGGCFRNFAPEIRKKFFDFLTMAEAVVERNATVSALRKLRQIDDQLGTSLASQCFQEGDFE
jgi:hypothetical protein